MNKLNFSGRLPRPGAALTGLLLALVLAHAAAVAREAADRYTVAVVRDGDGPGLVDAGRIRGELAGLLPAGTELIWRDDAAFAGDWTAAGAAAALDRALAEPGVDAVLAVGVLVTRAAADPVRALERPVLSTHVRRADMDMLPMAADGAIARPNLFFTAIPQRIERDVATFRDMVRFDTLHVLVGRELLAALPDLPGLIRHAASGLDVAVEIVPVSVAAGGAAVLDLPEGVEAAYLTGLQRLGDGARRELLDRLTQRGAATFGLLGHPDVERGALLGLAPDISTQVARRVALGLNTLARGGEVADLPTLLTVDTRLLINGRTAARIGWAPPVEARLFGRFLHAEALEPPAEPLDLARVLTLVQEGNWELRIADARVDAADADRRLARSGLGPRLIGELGYQAVENDFRLLVADDDFALGRLALRQPLFDDGSRSGFEASKERAEGSRQERESARLDLMGQAGLAFYRLALAETVQEIQAGNLRLTEDFLELARLRREVGYSGREEILRWQSELADQRSALLQAIQDVRTARIELNRILGLPQEWRWRIRREPLDDGTFPFLDGRLNGVARNIAALDAVRDEAVRLALERSPELLALDRSIDAGSIVNGQLRRSYYLPSLYLDAGYQDRLTSPDADQQFAYEESWSVGVTATYPIYTGGQRKGQVLRSEAELSALRSRWQDAAQRVEQAARDSLRRLETSFPSIRFARESAAAAAENLGLMRDRYTEGLINVTDLLEAQNRKFTADSLAAASEYQLLSDLVLFQRALAWFEAEHDAAARAELAERFLAAAAVAP